MPRSVLILGARAPVALDHARRFAAHGWRVYVADSVSMQLTASSRSVSGSVMLPSPRFQGLEFCRALERYATDQRIDLVVPTCEEVFFLSRFRERMPRTLVIAVDEFDKLKRLHSKLAFLEDARNCGFDTPQSAAVTTLAQAREWAGARPCVIKPEFSRFGVFVRIYREGIPEHAPALAALGRWVVQECCEGTELCSYSVAAAGQLLAHQVYRPSYRLGRSSSYYFEPAAEPRIEACVRAFVAAVRFTGQISFDWIRDTDGRCSVLECNPRATSGLHLFDLQDALPDALIGEGAVLPHSREPQPRMIAAVMATSGIWDACRRGALTQWRRDFARARDVIALPADQRPLFGGFVDVASYARLALQQRCSLREAATRDIEWDGQPI